MLTLLHASDLHFGKRHDPAAARHLLDLAELVQPDLIVLSGDLTQRAKAREYASAARYLAGLPDTPVVVTTGNHDVPLYRVWERVFAPFRNYKRAIARDLDTLMEVGGAAVVSLSSAAPRRAIVNGRIDEAQLDWAENAFTEAAGAWLRVAVIHHALTEPPDGGRDRPLPGADRIVARLGAMGVELVLSGHFHRAFATRAGSGGPLLVHSGTTTSTRGRAAERDKNSCNVIRARRSGMEVVPHERPYGGGPFVALPSASFPRVAHADAGGGADPDARVASQRDARPVAGNDEQGSGAAASRSPDPDSADARAGPGVATRTADPT